MQMRERKSEGRSHSAPFWWLHLRPRLIFLETQTHSPLHTRPLSPNTDGWGTMTFAFTRFKCGTRMERDPSDFLPHFRAAADIPLWYQTHPLLRVGHQLLISSCLDSKHLSVAIFSCFAYLKFWRRLFSFFWKSALIVLSIAKTQQIYILQAIGFMNEWFK